MKTNCSACGAQNEVGLKNCTYCGNVLTISEEMQNRIDSLNENGNYFKLAEVAFEGGNYDEAINYYNKCLEKDTNFFECWYKKGLSTLMTSSVGNLKGQMASSSFRIALNNAPNKESFILRLRKDVLPFINKYLFVAFEHFKSYFTLAGSGPEFAEKIARAYDSIDFVISEAGIDIAEVKQLYDTLQKVDKSTRKVMQQAFLQKGGVDKINNDLSIATKKIVEIQNEKLLPIWQKLEPSTAPKRRNVGCFIATAAMGSYEHPVVMDLRYFRDQWLLKREWGQNFTNWYYTHGPKAARVIEKSTFLKKMTYVAIVKPLQILTKKLR